MGVGFVLLIWAIVGFIFACVSAAVFGGVSAYFTRGAQRGRKRLIVAASLFPFACLTWIAVIFAIQAVVNEGFLTRDPGIGDTWHCPLPNGYQILMIDTTDQGWVFNPKTQPDGAVSEQDDSIGGIRILQVADRYILGGSDSHSFEHREQHDAQIDSYFLLDTQAGKHIVFPNYEALRQATEPLGIKPKLDPIASVYAKYRFSWFEVFAGILTLLLPLIFAFLLLRSFIRVRRNRAIALRPT